MGVKFRAHLPCIALLFACGILFSLAIHSQNLSCLRTSQLLFSCLIFNFLLCVFLFIRKRPTATTLCLYLSFFLIGALTLQRQLIPGQSPHFPREGEQVEWTGLDVSDTGQITELGYARVNPIKAAAIRFKKRASSVIDKTFPCPQSGFLKAILLGNRSSLPLQWKEHFSRTGTSYILAISGIHVWMIIGIFFALFQATGLSRRSVALASVAVLLFYCMLVGARTPVMRASIMAGATLIGKIINRPTKPWNNLALASIVLLAINPLEIANVGFQLSFLAAGGIIYLSPRLENALTLRPSIKKTICPIFSAQIATIPIVACHFNILSPIAFIANLVIIPLLGIILALGLTGCTLGFASITLAAIFNKTGSLLITALVEITRFLSRVPFSHIYVQSPGIPFILAYYSAVIILSRKYLGLGKNKRV